MKKLAKITLHVFLLATLVWGFFGFHVLADADKTLLISAHDQVQTIITTQDNSPIGDPYYEEASYQAFFDSITALGGVDGIQAVINDPVALQVDVDNLTNDINNAIAGLTTSDTFYATWANYSQAKTIDLNPYTTDSQTLYNNEMDRIETILDNPTSGEQAIDDLNNDIDSASNLLVLRGDKTNLISKKNTIDTIYSSDGTDYIPSTFDSFQSAYDNIDTNLTNDIGMTLQELIDDIDALPEEVATAETRLDEITALLIERPDKTTLIADYQDAVSLDEALYTSASYSDFELILLSVLDVINDEEATQEDVNQSETDLIDSYSVLVLKADLTELSAAYEIALAQDLSTYTPASITNYLAELDKINDIIVANDSDQSEADDALSDLNELINILVLQADRSTLEILNQLVIIAYYEEKAIYTQSSHLAFKTAVDAYGSYLYVNSVINNDNIDQTTVDNLIIIMEDALSLLDLLIDNSELLAVYATYVALDLSLYTQNSQDLYNAELDRIYAILTSKELNNDAALQIMLDFGLVTSLLVELPDLTELQIVYDNTRIYREEDYSISSYGALKIAKDNATTVMNDNNADADMVEDAITLIQTSIANLVRRAETIYIFEEQSIDINQYVTLGQATVIRYYTGDEEILRVNDQGVITGVRFGDTIAYIELSNGYTETIDIHVKAKINTTVFVLTITIPVASIGLGTAIIYVQKDTWIKMWRAVTKIFRKRT